MLRFFDVTEREVLCVAEKYGVSLAFSKNGLKLDATVLNNALNDNSLAFLEHLKGSFGCKFYSDCGLTLAQAVAEKLVGTNHVLATAESLTGGMVAADLVSVSGISKWFYEGIVAYDNSAKISRLNVKSHTLEKHGAVSEQTAFEMVLGLIEHGNTLAVSTTGIAGPTGGSKEKPVGTVWFGLADNNGVLYAEKRVFSGDRSKIRQDSTDCALYLLLRYLCGEFRLK